MATQAQTEMQAMLVDLSSAVSLAELHALYVNWIGLGALDEDVTETGNTGAAELRGILQDHVREFCYATGTPCPNFAVARVHVAGLDADALNALWCEWIGADRAPVTHAHTVGLQRILLEHAAEIGS